MNRLTRITAILIQLQSKHVVTAREIAKRFEVSLRTVYRDISTLQDAGVPIGSEQGVGYYLVDGFKLPPIAVTEEEANSLIISEVFIQKQGDTSLTKNFSSLVYKIKATLKNFEKDKVELLSSRTMTFNKEKQVESGWLSAIQKSIANRRQLRIVYRSIYKDEKTSRTIEPQAIYFTNHTWVVVAYCLLREDLREFRVDRIEDLAITDDRCIELINFSLQSYFKQLQN